MSGQIVIKRVRINGGGVTEVSIDERYHTKAATHLSVYVQHPDGTETWHCDDAVSSAAWTHAVIEAAKLSMQYQYPIKPFK